MFHFVIFQNFQFFEIFYAINIHNGIHETQDDKKTKQNTRWDGKLSPKLTSHSPLCESKLEKEIKREKMKSKYLQSWGCTYLELLAELGGRGPLASDLFNRERRDEAEKWRLNVS